MKFIAVDWGSSSFRAYLIDDALSIVDQIKNNKGVLGHCNSGFAATLLQACGAWLKRWPQLPIVMAGMIGSRNGWEEAPYIPCPIDSRGLGVHLNELNLLPDVQLLLVPGVSGLSPSNAPDVMRGEEVQIFGALQLAETADTTICLPGTHSKWSRVENNHIVQFSTFFTGEIFALLREHSSIGVVLDNNPIDEASFIEGVEYSGSAGGFLHHVFTARARRLASNCQAASLMSYLSGIAIGHELSGARVLYGNLGRALVVGTKPLQRLYQLAAGVYGCELITVDADRSFVYGLCSIMENYLPK